MFRYTIWCDCVDVASGVWQFLPRIGERIALSGYLFEVEMITYHVASGNFSGVTVHIDAKRV